MYLKKRKKKKKKWHRIGLERETKEFLQQMLYHGKDVVFIQTAMGITHFHCKTITLAVICDEQFWEVQEWIWADLWANYSALSLLSKRTYRQYIKEQVWLFSNKALFTKHAVALRPQCDNSFISQVSHQILMTSTRPFMTFEFRLFFPSLYHTSLHYYFHST